MQSSKSGGTQTTTQKSEPWADQQPYLKDVFSQAQSQYNTSNPSYYPGSTVAGQSGDTQNALNMARTAVGTGQQGLTDSIGVANNTARGDYLSPDSNPWLKGTYDAAAAPVMRNFQTAVAPSIDGGAVAGGRYGSGAWSNAQRGAQDSLGQTLGGMASNIYGGNYQAERDRQMSAVNNAGSTYGMGFLPSQSLDTIGQTQDARSQTMLDADIQRFNYNQNLPAAKLGQYQQMVNGNYGGTSQTETPIQSNPLGSILGGLFGIGSLASGFGGMGGLGGLGSLFGGSGWGGMR